MSLNHDGVTEMLAQKIEDGINQINAANEVLLADEAGTGVREIDRALKEGTDDEEVNKAFEKAKKAREAFVKAQDAARNLYRTNVLQEDAVSETSEVDKDEVKVQRKMVVEAVNLLKTYSTANGKKDVAQWAESLEIPQVGRAGSSTVGQRKPRAYVSVDGETFDSFGPAAKHASELLSTDDEKVTVTTGDLVKAWEQNDETTSDFAWEGLTLRVALKSKD